MALALPAFVFLLLEPPRWFLSSQSVSGEDYNIGSFVTLALCSDIDTSFLPPRPFPLSVYAILKPFRSVSRRKLTEGITSNSCCSALALALFRSARLVLYVSYNRASWRNRKEDEALVAGVKFIWWASSEHTLTIYFYLLSITSLHNDHTDFTPMTLHQPA